MYNPLENGGIVVEDQAFHTYTIQLDNSQTTELIEETDYILTLKQDEPENGEHIIQSIKYGISNTSMTIKFSGPEPADETIEWLDKILNRVLNKANSPPAY